VHDLGERLEQAMERVEKHIAELMQDKEFATELDALKHLLRPEPGFDEPEPEVDPESDSLDDLFAWGHWFARKYGITSEYSDAVVKLVRKHGGAQAALRASGGGEA